MTQRGCSYTGKINCHVYSSALQNKTIHRNVVYCVTFPGLVSARITATLSFCLPLSICFGAIQCVCLFISHTAPVSSVIFDFFFNISLSPPWYESVLLLMSLRVLVCKFIVLSVVVKVVVKCKCSQETG